jgi:putative ABC transport system permease protein
MTVLKRGFLYITRKRGRSILLLAIMLITAVSAMLGLAIKAGADKQAAALRRSLCSSFTVEMDPEAIKELMDSYGGDVPKDKRPDAISSGLIDRIMEMEHITGYFTCDTYPFVWFDMELSPGLYAGLYERSLKDASVLSEFHTSLDSLNMWKHQTEIYGCNDSGLHENFRNGAFTLTQGRHIREDDVNKTMIPASLAQKNHLTVGDMITAELRDSTFTGGGDLDKILGEPIKLEVVGIYDANLEQQPSTETINGETYVNSPECMLVDNMIFCDLNTALQLNNFIRAQNNVKKDTLLLDNVTFFVDDPIDLAAAVDGVRAISDIDQKYYTIEPDDSAYRASVKPLTQLSTVSAVLIITAVAGCAALLGLLMNMWTKGRKREIGILLSLGVSKQGIALQLLLETLATSVTAIVAALLLSGALLVTVGNIADRTFSPKGTEEKFSVRYGAMSTKPIVDKVSADPVNLTYSLSAQNVLLAAAAVLGSTAFSVAVTARNIMKTKPKDVMSAV